jgi:hypothetical protein
VFFKDAADVDFTTVQDRSIVWDDTTTGMTQIITD